ncbi:hypothetical protein Y032_0041g470 [Ancylostoma ceylanicum]|uniref:Uncharacterized protein n=1 Tax=Ancylostoma ceylanicum TaxID=53326 RepID=A0A016UHC7_9BILA|nr:hypothetical protein Y032_0041g470 [Ancylostoma ceylanicum]
MRGVRLVTAVGKVGAHLARISSTSDEEEEELSDDVLRMVFDDEDFLRERSGMKRLGACFGRKRLVPVLNPPPPLSTVVLFLKFPRGENLQKLLITIVYDTPCKTAGKPVFQPRFQRSLWAEPVGKRREDELPE